MDPTLRARLHAQVDAQLEDDVARVQRWVRQPSVSWHAHGVDVMARLVADELADLGCAGVEVLEGRRLPSVWGRLDVGAPVTVHVYGMFDTRTVNPERWTHDPFGAELVAKDGYPRVLVGRGATGAKGPFVAFLNAVRATLAATGTLPMNLCFLAEGEEILGSPTYAAHVARLRPRMADVVASFNPSSAQAGPDAVAIGLGLKGMVVVELTASGERWPHAPKRTIHSSAAGLVDSPPFRLAQALATLTEPDGSGCRVPELAARWHARAALDPAREAALQRLRARHADRDPRDALPLGGVANVDALRGDDPLRDLLYGPTFNVAGLRAGFLGPNTGTIPFVVPGSATATLDVRSAFDDLSADAIVAALRRHLDRHGFEDVAIDVLAAYDPHQTDPEHPLVAAAEATLAAHGYASVVWPIQPGGGPWTAVPRALGVPCLRGAVPGGGTAGDDEYLVIDGDARTAGLAEATKVHVDLLHAAAAALAPS